MNIVQINGLFINLIIYIIMILPILFLSLYKKIYKTKRSFINSLICATIFETFLSLFLHIFSRNIFTFFSNSTGVINYAIYCFRILFITSSLFSIKILCPAYLLNNKHKKTTILVLSKIVVNVILAFIGFLFFNIKGFLYSFPICDLIYYIIYTIIFLDIIRNDI